MLTCTGTLRVKGGGRFKATTFCFLTVIFNVVVALLGVFSFFSFFLFFFFEILRLLTKHILQLQNLKLKESI